MIRRPPRSPLFPTRRSSDLRTLSPGTISGGRGELLQIEGIAAALPEDLLPARLIDTRSKQLGGDPPGERRQSDRKSTRLNSSHTVISYAVFCLKKKK